MPCFENGYGIVGMRLWRYGLKAAGGRRGAFQVVRCIGQYFGQYSGQYFGQYFKTLRMVLNVLQKGISNTTTWYPVPGYGIYAWE